MDIFKKPYGFDEVWNSASEVPLIEENRGLDQQRSEIKERMLQTQFSSQSQIQQIVVYAKNGDEVIHFDYEINVSSSFNPNDYSVTLRDDDPLHVVDRFVSGQRISEFIFTRDTFKPNLYWTHISDKNASKYKTIIWSWFYDKELKLFVLKRPEGCQYLAWKERHFRSLCEEDLHELGNNWIINPSDDGLADIVGKNLRRDFWLRKNMQDSDKPQYKIEPRSKKRTVKPDGTVEYVQRDIKCMIKVPAKKWAQDILDKMDNWEIDRNSGEAKMYADSQKKILLRRVYDPMQMVNFSRNDLRKLYDTECSFLPFWKHEETRYRKILQLCLHDDIHANSKRLLFDE